MKKIINIDSLYRNSLTTCINQFQINNYVNTFFFSGTKLFTSEMVLLSAAEDSDSDGSSSPDYSWVFILLGVVIAICAIAKILSSN